MKSNFTLLDDRIEFDENGDPLHKFYKIVFWDQRGEAEEVGIYKFNPYPHFFINNSKIRWHSNDTVSSFFLFYLIANTANSYNCSHIIMCINICKTQSLCNTFSFTGADFSVFQRMSCRTCKKAKWNQKMLLHL